MIKKFSALAVLLTGAIGLALAGLPDLGYAESNAGPSVESLREMYSLPPDQWPAAVVDPSVEPVELGPLPEVEHPADNQPTDERIELGRMLFYDPRLSTSNQIACVSCHDPDLGWADGRTVSFGHRRIELKRNAPTAQYAGHWDVLFWDGRSDSLEDLTIKVITNENELRSNPDEIYAKINAIPEYRQRFKDAYDADEVTIDLVAKAVANFMRSNNGGRSPFDAFLRGRTNALSDEAVRGLHVYRTQAGCMNCHSGPLFSDNLLHNTGLTLYGRPEQDLGQYNVTQQPEDVGKFKTPTLRNIANTRPFMHHGLFGDLHVVVRAYDGGMPKLRRRKDQLDDPLFPTKSPLVKPLDLTAQQVDDLVAFLEALSEPHRRIRPPQLPPDP